MIPIRDELPTRRFPVITIFLVVINTVIFLYEVLMGPSLDSFIGQTGLIPAVLWGKESFLFSSFSPWWTLITSLFLHANVVHLGTNMLYLWIFGNNVEDFLGWWQYLIFYLTCGMVASFTHAILSPSSLIPTIGASGAIAGVMGGYIILFPGARVVVLVVAGFFIRLIRVPALVVLGSWIILQVIFGLLSFNSQNGGGVAWFAHIGGFLFGLLWCKIVSTRYYRTTHW